MILGTRCEEARGTSRIRRFVLFLALMLAVSLCMNLFAAARIKELGIRMERMEETLGRAEEGFLDMAQIIDSLPKPAHRENIR